MTTHQDTIAIFCRKCGYALIGLSEARCPECGRPFDPADPRSFLRLPHTWSLRRWLRRLSWVLASLAVGFLLYVGGLWAYLRVNYYRSALAEKPHIAALQQAGCTITLAAAGTWARDLAKPFGWYYMTESARDLIQGWQQPLSAGDLRHMAALGKLRTLRVGMGPFDAAGLAYLDNLRDLESLEIYPAVGSRTATGCPARRMGINAQMQHLEGLTQLQAVFLSYTDVNNDGLRHLRGLSRISMLSLDCTQITDEGLAYLVGMKHMRYLDLTGTAIRGPGLAHLSGMTEMARLDLSDTQVGDADLSQLSALPWLDELRLSNTRITDAGLVTLQSYPRLSTLNVSGTAVTAEGVQRLKQQRPRMTIYGP